MSRCSYQLAFVDLDGTLLGPDKTVSAENRAALARLKEAGVEVVPASGRHHANMQSFAASGELGWVLSSQGAMVQNREEVLLEVTMNPALVRQLCAEGQAQGMSLVAYLKENAYVDDAQSPWIQHYYRQTGWQPAARDFRELPPEQFQKIIWTQAAEKIDVEAPARQREFAGKAHVVVTDPEFLEFLDPSVNKATGAHALATRLGVAPENILAFGDGHNDVEILQWAGQSVAMRHGRQSAQDAAKFISPPGPPETAFARAVKLALEG